ncbi:unnamed protein product [Caenorhabditis nigoni]
MANNGKGDSPSLRLENNEIVEKLELVAAETEEIKSSQKRKFDEFAEKLQSIEESISKISTFENNEKKLKTNKSFVLKHVFKNVANFKEDDGVSSEEEEHFNAKWSMEIMRNGRHLEFFVWWEPVTHFEDNWAIETKMEYSMMGMGYTGFYVLKKYLALQSSYFKSLFFGKFSESQKNVVELKDVDPNDFQKFLELIHGESSVNDDNVTGILRLADMYDTPTAMRRCEEFLMKNSQKSIAQKLQLALRYNSENLKNKCLSEITKMSDVESIMAANLPELDLSTSKALLQKCIDFSKK